MLRLIPSLINTINIATVCMSPRNPSQHHDNVGRPLLISYKVAEKDSLYMGHGIALAIMTILKRIAFGMSKTSYLLPDRINDNH